MLKMTKTEDGRLMVDFVDGTFIGILQPANSDKHHARLMDLAYHHFNAYEAMVALLKECHENRLIYWANSKSLVDDLLAIAEPKVLKIGDVVPAGEVPVGATVEIKGTVGAKTRRKSVNDNETLACFDCELCGTHGTRLIATNAECTIVELPEKG